MRHNSLLTFPSFFILLYQRVPFPSLIFLRSFFLCPPVIQPLLQRFAVLPHDTCTRGLTILMQPSQNKCNVSRLCLYKGWLCYVKNKHFFHISKNCFWKLLMLSISSLSPMFSYSQFVCFSLNCGYQIGLIRTWRLWTQLYLLYITPFLKAYSPMCFTEHNFLSFPSQSPEAVRGFEDRGWDHLETALLAVFLTTTSGQAACEFGVKQEDGLDRGYRFSLNRGSVNETGQENILLLSVIW